jgi:putative tryptophan/tyrosine transport system substrate-binding protein
MRRIHRRTKWISMCTREKSKAMDIRQQAMVGRTGACPETEPKGVRQFGGPTRRSAPTGVRQAALQMSSPANGKWFRGRQWVGLSVIAFVLVVCEAAAEAQQSKKLPRIGYLSSRDRASDSSRADAILLGLRELGYSDGQNIFIEYRYADGKRERFSELAAEMVRLKVDIILVVGGDALVRPVMNATKTIPIIMTGGGADPVSTGLIQSLARPGGNVTGVTSLVVDLSGKRLELFKEAIPKLARVAVLYEPTNPASVSEVKELLPAVARALRLTLQNWEVRTADDFDKVLASIGKQRPDGIYVSPGALVNTNQKRIAEFAINRKLPSLFARREVIEEGGLMYYGGDLVESYRRVAYYIDRILKGAKPADLPVEQPTKFELVFNLKTAKQIGLTIPQSLLYRADRVIR